ncbi:hypothetical protein DFH07DRAFT_932835 [Mycena maculata]|uniref:F-box domain-containing protein n=1 Tax=Mycena maculata TaxID=230809 RepID=A0AAD7HII3_9AGAR|nr:hypothetical protein DFH07DRAFT_932835 [Mycena maculata]
MSLTACSRALQIPEIVHMICLEADAKLAYLRQHTLPSLARTSRIFSGSALDLIWRELESLVPLIKCMPETLWEERTEGSGPRTAKCIHLRHPIMSTDIPRLLFYSVRVKSLYIHSDIRYGSVHLEVLQALDLCLANQVLMPALSDLVWAPAKKELQTFGHHFLGPSSRQIDIRLDNSRPSLSLLPYLKTSCPLLYDVRLSLTATPLTVRLVSDAVCGWQHLKELAIPALDQPGFIHVSRLPSLTKLSLYCVNGPGLYLPGFLSGPTFPALEDLSMNCETARFCTGLIQVVSSRQLGSLSIDPLANWTTSAWKELLTTLRDYLDHTALETLEVQQEASQHSRPADPASYILSADTLRPLLAFKKLSSLTFQIYPGVDVDDDFLAEMAVAWRRISSLEFGSEVLMSERPKPTLKCLVTFARHCPRLNGLGIRVDGSTIPPFSQVPGKRICHSLNSLNVGTSPMNSLRVAEMAAFLSNLFPDLEYLFTHDSNTPLTEPLASYAKSWSAVSDLLPVFCSVRAQEEEFWTQEFASEESDEESDEDEEMDGESRSS